MDWFLLCYSLAKRKQKSQISEGVKEILRQSGPEVTLQFTGWTLEGVLLADSMYFRTSSKINRLTPNDPYMGLTAKLTSKHFILYIYSTNIGTEYFKHVLHSPFFLFKMQFVS